MFYVNSQESINCYTASQPSNTYIIVKMVYVCPLFGIMWKINRAASDNMGLDNHNDPKVWRVYARKNRKQSKHAEVA